MSPEFMPWIAGGAGFLIVLVIINAMTAPSRTAAEYQRTAWKLIDAVDDLADEVKALREEIRKNSPRQSG